MNPTGATLGALKRRPPDVSPAHSRGWWCSQNQIKIPSALSQDTYWMKLEKNRWLSPCQSHTRLGAHVD